MCVRESGIACVCVYRECTRAVSVLSSRFGVNAVAVRISENAALRLEFHDNFLGEYDETNPIEQ